MRKPRRVGLPALFALLLVGGLAACSATDKVGIVLNVKTDGTVNSAAVTSLQVTVGDKTQVYSVSSSNPLPGSLGIKTSPGTKHILVVATNSDGNPLASGEVDVSVASGKVVTFDVTLSPIAATGDAAIPLDSNPVATGGVPELDAASDLGAPPSTGGRTGTTGGITSTGGVTSIGGLSTTGGTSRTGGASGVGGASGFDGGPGIDAPPSTGGGSGATDGAVGGTSSAGGTSRSGGVTSVGGLSSTGGTGPTGGTSNVGGVTSTAGASSSGGSTPTGGTINTGGSTGGSTTAKRVATAVAAGYGHSCALIADGTIWCWGNNSDGDLGNGAVVDGKATVISPVAVKVLNITQAVSVATGKFHTCAVLATGTVQCWGYNGDGQLGNGSTGGRSSTPVDVFGITNGLAVVAGTNHTCALLKDNTVKCWGDNTYNQLGNGNDTPSVLPAPVVTSASPTTPLGQVTALALRTNHTCAVQSSGSVYCWGDNDSGQLGNGNTDPATVAVKAANVQAVAVSVGDTHSCVLASGGTMQCWGSNFWYGELGDGTNIDSVLPVTAKIPGKASAIGLGSSHSCAVVDITNGTKGAIECWGRNFYGQLGNGKTIDSAVPVSALALSQAQSVAGGEEYTCAVISGGAVYCWGDNYFGQLGDGLGAPNVESYIPKLVVGF